MKNYWNQIPYNSIPQKWEILSMGTFSSEPNTLEHFQLYRVVLIPLGFSLYLHQFFWSAVTLLDFLPVSIPEPGNLWCILRCPELHTVPWNSFVQPPLCPSSQSHKFPTYHVNRSIPNCWEDCTDPWIPCLNETLISGWVMWYRCIDILLKIIWRLERV